MIKKRLEMTREIKWIRTIFQGVLEGHVQVGPCLWTWRTSEVPKQSTIDQEQTRRKTHSQPRWLMLTWTRNWHGKWERKCQKEKKYAGKAEKEGIIDSQTKTWTWTWPPVILWMTKDLFLNSTEIPARETPPSQTHRQTDRQTHTQTQTHRHTLKKKRTIYNK